MHEITLTAVSIGDADIERISYRGQQVVTFAMIDKVHKRPDGTAKRNFNENRERFIEGEDYVFAGVSQKDEFRTFGIEVPNRGLMLITRRGYLKIVKSLNDDLAWQVFDEMIERYFIVEKLAAQPALSAADVVKIIDQKLEAVLPALLESVIDKLVDAKIAAQAFTVRRGVTAGQVWKQYRLPKVKNGHLWLGNRLVEMGAQIDNEGRGELGLTTARLFDPDRVAVCMRNGLEVMARRYADERLGQQKLRLVGGSVPA